MRVLRICSVFEAPATALSGAGGGLDPIGGMQTHAAALTRALDRLGVEQTVLTAARRGARRSQRLGQRSRVLRVGVPVRPLRQLYSAPAAALAPSLAARADLVHVHAGEDLAVVPIAALAARAGRAPLVLTVHTSLRHTVPALDARTALLRRAGGPIEAWGERRADAVIALTERLRRLLVADGVDPTRVAVVPSGVERGLFDGAGRDPFPHVRGRRVLFVGRLARQKGVETLVRAAARLRARDIHVLVVGDGPERARLERLVGRLGVDDRVQLLGFLPHERVPAALAHAELLVLPSVYEELGSVLLEAMQAGLPIVASRAGGIPDAVTHGESALLVPPGDDAALAGAIDRVLADRELAARLLAVYERVLGRSAGAAGLGARDRGTAAAVDDEREPPAGTPEPSAGSAEPSPEREPPGPDLDPELLEQGGNVPRLDALDPGESGAPITGPGSGAADGPGPGSRYEGGAGGSGAVVGPMRDRGHDLADDEERAAGGGPPAGHPRGERTSDAG